MVSTLSEAGVAGAAAAERLIAAQNVEKATRERDAAIARDERRARWAAHWSNMLNRATYAVTRLPGLLAIACGTWAAWDAFGRAAGLAVLAAFLLLVDRRMP